MRPLSFLRTLQFYDVPQIFVATDALGIHYLCTLYNHGLEGYQYLGVQISEPRLRAFVCGQLDLRSAYIHPEAEGAVWVVNVRQQQIEAQHQIKPDELTEDMLPEAGFYFDSSDLTDEAEDSTDTYQLEVPANDRITFSTLISRMGWKAQALKKSMGKIAVL